MGLLGALFAGVSGLDSQSNAIGIISNNISNVNTVGYKQGAASFDTLVVPSGTTSFSPGGVIGNTNQLINQQGLIQATSSATDIAITGGGLMVVSTTASGAGAGNYLYTRAGSFTQDSNGNFVNANGYFLQGLPIQASGSAEQPDTQNLTTVNVSSSATGTATATSIVNMAANLNSQQTIFPGSSATGTMTVGNDTSTNNAGINGSTIIVGNDYDNSATTSNLTRGDSFTILSGATPDVFTYGGFIAGRNVVTNTTGDGGNALTTQTLVAGDLSTSTTTTTTTSAITNINLSSTTAVATGTGAFDAGTLDIGTSAGIKPVTITAGMNLTQIASAIQTVVSGYDANSTATVTGSPGNYAITVIDKHSGSLGFSGAAVTGNNPTFTVVAPVSTPSATQMTITLGPPISVIIPWATI